MKNNFKPFCLPAGQEKNLSDRELKVLTEVGLLILKTFNFLTKNGTTKIL